MNRMIFALGGAAAVVVVGVLALGLYFNSPGVGAPPSPSPTPELTPAATSTPTTTPTATAEPTNTPDAGLPEGPYVLDPDGDFSSEDSGMALSVTIPAPGWTFAEEWALLEKGTEVDNVPEAAILFWAFPGEELYVPADACQGTSTRPETPSATPEEIAAALAAQTPRDGSEPVDVTLSGYEGKFTALSVPGDAELGECEEGEFVQYVTSKGDFVRNAQGPGQIEELWILDVDGTIVIIFATYRPDTPAALVEEMRGMVDSTTFDTP